MVVEKGYVCIACYSRCNLKSIPPICYTELLHYSGNPVPLFLFPGTRYYTWKPVSVAGERRRASKKDYNIMPLVYLYAIHTRKGRGRECSFLLSVPNFDADNFLEYRKDQHYIIARFCPNMGKTLLLEALDFITAC